MTTAVKKGLTDILHLHSTLLSSARNEGASKTAAMYPSAHGSDTWLSQIAYNIRYCCAL